MRFEKKVEQLRIQKHDGRETKSFLKDVINMAEGEPLEYILGEVEFCGAVIDLSLRPMIPRPETEHWVAQAIQDIKDNRQQTLDNRQGSSEEHEQPSVVRALDLFSGSGCVGIALAKNISNLTIDMIEFDEKLKKQIEISLIKNLIEPSRAKVITGDVWGGASGLYDVITAVPPYVPKDMKEEVMEELSREDPLFLFDKEDGYFYHKQVLSRVKEFLNKGGKLYLEFDITQKEKIEQLAVEYDLKDYTFIIDPYRHDFVFVYTQK